MEPSTALIVLAIAVLLAILGKKIVDLQTRLAMLSRVESKLDLLLERAGIVYDPFKHLPPVVANALQRGEGKIQVIKRYREATGVGLKEAKEFVEEVMRRDGRG